MMHYLFQSSKLHAIIAILFLGFCFALPVHAAPTDETPHRDTVLSPPMAPMGAAYGCNPTGSSSSFRPGSYVTTFNGHRSALVVGNGYTASKPTYLAVVLHGQHTFWRDFAKDANNPVTKLVNEQGWILVAPKAPDGSAWKLDSNGAHRKKLTQVLNKVFNQFNVCRDYYMVAADGTAGNFFTSDFFPRKADNFPAHAFIACGGNDNLSSFERNKLKQISQNANLHDRSRFYYVVGRNDNNFFTIRDSFRTYRDYNFRVHVDRLDGVGGCSQWSTSVERTIVQKWKFFASKFPTASGAGSDSGSSSPTPTPTPISSDGGGSTASACNPSNGSGGLKPGLYKTTVAGLKAGVVVGDNYDPSKPTYMAFFLHGDGANWQSYVENKNNPVTKLVREQGWIMVIPESPNGKWWWKNWNGDHNKKLAAVFDEMFRKYNVCQNYLLGSSGSGGSEFYTRLFYPRYGGQYPAHMLVACGGNDTNSSSDIKKLRQLGQNADIRERTKMYFLYGTEDYLVPLIKDAIAQYRNFNFDVQVEKMSGAGHCNKWKNEGRPTLKEHIAEKWQRFVKGFPSASGANRMAVSTVPDAITSPVVEPLPQESPLPIQPVQGGYIIYMPIITD